MEVVVGQVVGVDAWNDHARTSARYTNEVAVIMIAKMATALPNPAWREGRKEGGGWLVQCKKYFFLGKKGVCGGVTVSASSHTCACMRISP